MKKLLLLFAVLLGTVGAWAQTETIVASTNVQNPEHVYYIKCCNSYGGNIYYMYHTTGPASTKANAAKFAFFESGEDYKIYCVDTQKWVTYTPSKNDNTRPFASLTDSQNDAEPWKITYVADGKDDVTTCYQFQPYSDEDAVYESYMNWNGGVKPAPSAAYDVDKEMAVGVWKQSATGDKGSAWVVEEVLQGIEEAKAELLAWEESIPVGTKVGQYTKDESAYSAAMAELEAAANADEIMDALDKCKAAYKVNGLVVGKYYRIKNTMHGTYTGLDGYTCNMKNFAEDLANPTMIWKYEQDGDRFFMKNVYADLYPQYVPAGGSATTQIGKGKENAFTYVLHAPAVKGGTDAQWNIFFGGRQVNIESNGNVNYWTADNAHHYLYEEEVTDEQLATMCMNWYNANEYTAPEATAGTYQKIDIDANATVIISPSEFAAPSVINEAIDNLAAVEGDLNVTVENVSDIHTLFAALVVYAPAKSALTAYKNAVTAHGELLSIAYTPKAEWGTIILPINWAKPEGWTRYSCAATEGNVLTLTEFPNGGTTKNSPMIIQVEEDKIGTTYQLIGYSNGAGTENVKSGLLTGVLEDNTIVPDGSYVLARQKSTGKIGFFPVAEGANYGLEKYKCYLTLAPASSRYNALFFDGTETAIESVEGEDENAKAVVYDLAGRRVQNAQKGIFIVNGKKVIK